MVDVKKPHGTDPASEPDKAAHTHAHDASHAAAPEAKTPESKTAESKPTESKPTESRHITKDEWNKAWDSSAAGRLAIRTFSRGVMGAAFFAVGGLWTRKLMMQPENVKLKYNADKEFTEILKEKNPLQFIAKTIDEFVGRPIQLTVNYFEGNGLAATHFKPTKYATQYKSLRNSPVKEVRGRSLGEETVFATFDFFCASIGDALGRDIAGWFDPAVKHDWQDDKGNIKFPEAVKSMVKSAWRYVSYNGGEDWAVAIPYVYFIRAQRGLIDKHITTGYAFESDIAMNASSLKINTKATPNLVSGSYSMEAMLDYQGRFTAYNIGTLMYREVYDKLGQAWYGKHINLYGDPHAQQDPNKGIGGKALDLVKWTMRSIAKGTLYMTPAIPFFSITRSTQNRQRALLIDPDKNAALSFMGSDGRPHFVSLSEMGGADGLDKNTRVAYAHFNPEGNKGLGKIETIPGSERSASVGNPLATNPNVYAYRNNGAENVLSWIGKKNNQLFMGARPLVREFEQTSFGGALKKVLGLATGPRTQHSARGYTGPDSLTRFSDGMINASVSYTPYMFMKAETAKLWDNGKTDLALERTIDGMFSGSWKEVKAGFNETLNAVLHRPFEDVERDRLAEYRLKSDTSAADSLSNRQASVSNEKVIHEKDRFTRSERVKTEAAAAPEGEHKFTNRIKSVASDIPWHERVIQGAKGDDGASLMDPNKSPKTHAEREAQRKLLEEAVPLTPSIH